MALSSSVEEVREAACHCLTRFQSHLEESKFSEKAQASRNEYGVKAAYFIIRGCYDL